MIKWICFSAWAGFWFAVGWLSQLLDWGHQNTPAWVQGIGSIIAIFVAIGTAAYQHHNDRVLRISNSREARISKLLGVCIHGLHAHAVLQELIPRARAFTINDGFLIRQRERLQVALRSFQDIDFSDLAPSDARGIATVLIMVADVYAATFMSELTYSSSPGDFASKLQEFDDKIMVELTLLDHAYKSLTGESTLPG